jgi:hypothetical protein
LQAFIFDRLGCFLLMVGRISVLIYSILWSKLCGDVSIVSYQHCLLHHSLVFFDQITSSPNISTSYDLRTQLVLQLSNEWIRPPTWGWSWTAKWLSGTILTLPLQRDSDGLQPNPLYLESHMTLLFIETLNKLSTNQFWAL